MNSMDYLGIDDRKALKQAPAMMHQLAAQHGHVTERIDLLSTNPGARSGMRAIYNMRLEAVVKAMNELAHVQREFEARCMDAMAACYGAEADCAVEYLAMIASGGSGKNMNR